MNLKLNVSLTRKIIYDLLHLAVLGLSIFLVVSISVDTFRNVAFYRQPEFMKVQFWVCIFFLSDFVIEFFMDHRKAHYLLTRSVFFLVSIPYESIIQYFGIELAPEIGYLLRFVPLVRGGYALAIVVGWFTANRAESMLVTYILTLMASVYFASMVFYVVEHDVNVGVVNYQDALWWACMEMVTTGSSISAVTPVGRFLGFAMSCLGMMMLPMFTVYITTLIQKHQSVLYTPKPKKTVETHKGSDGEGEEK